MSSNCDASSSTKSRRHRHNEHRSSLSHTENTKKERSSKTCNKEQTKCDTNSFASPGGIRITEEAYGAIGVSGDTFVRLLYPMYERFTRENLVPWVVFMIFNTGRAAEFFGPSGVSNDVTVRTFTYTDDEYREQYEKRCDTPLSKANLHALVAALNDTITRTNSGIDLQYPMPAYFIANGIVPIPTFTWLDMLRATTTTLYQFTNFFGYLRQLNTNPSQLTALRTFYASNPSMGDRVYDDLNPPRSTGYHTYAISTGTTISNKCDCDAKSSHCCGKQQEFKDRQSCGKDRSNTNSCDPCDEDDDLLNHYRQVNPHMADAWSCIRRSTDSCDCANADLLCGFLKSRADCGLFRLGSYGAVISGAKTKSGNPLLLTGPQLANTTNLGTFNAYLESTDQPPLHLAMLAIAGHAQGLWVNTPYLSTGIQVTNTGVHSYSLPYLEDAATEVYVHRTETILVKGGVPILLAVRRAVRGHCFAGAFVHPIYPAPTYAPGAKATVVRHPDFLRDAVWGFGLLEIITSSRTAKEYAEVATRPPFAYSNGFDMCIVDREGNIGYMTMGGSYVDLPLSVENRFAQGFENRTPFYPTESMVRRKLKVFNPKQAHMSGWNTELLPDIPRAQGAQVVNRAFWIDQFIEGHDDWTYCKLRDIFIYNARANATASRTAGYTNQNANFFNLVFREHFVRAVECQPTITPDQRAALALLQHMFDGGIVSFSLEDVIARTTYSDAFILSLAWRYRVIFNVFTGRLPPAQIATFVTGGSIGGQPLGGYLDTVLSKLLKNCTYDGLGDPLRIDWLEGRDLNAIIVQSLNEALAILTGSPGPFNGNLPQFAYPRPRVNLVNEFNAAVYSRLSVNVPVWILAAEYDVKRGKLKRVGYTNFHGISAKPTSPNYVDQVQPWVNFEILPRRLPCEQRTDRT